MRIDRSEYNAVQGFKDGQRLVRRDLPVRQPPKFPVVNVMGIILGIVTIALTLREVF